MEFCKRLDQVGITVTRSWEDGSVDKEEAQWLEVDAAYVHKQSCYTVDQIRIEFTTGEGEVLATESMEGWEAFIDALPTYLPGALVKADWWDKVVLPSFATNWTTFFTRR
jgi:hypothetical protein